MESGCLTQLCGEYLIQLHLRSRNHASQWRKLFLYKIEDFQVSEQTRAFSFELPIKGRRSRIKSFYPLMNPGPDKNIIALAISFHTGELKRYDIDIYQSLILIDLRRKEIVVDQSDKVNQIAFR